MEKIDNFFDEISTYIPVEYRSYFHNNRRKFEYIWEMFLPTKWTPIIQDNKTIKISMKNNNNEFVDIISFLKYLEMLYGLRLCDGIETIKNKLNNPSQVLDTLFEIKSAHLCFRNKGVRNLAFEPEIKNKHGIKYPEFKFNFFEHVFYCECKSILSLNRARNSSAIKYAESLYDILTTISVPKELRLEILVKSIPNLPLKKQKPILLEAINNLINIKTMEPVKFSIGKEGKIQLLLQPNINKYPKYCDIFVGLNPRYINKAHEEKDYAIIIASRCENIITAIKSAIREANTQLLDDKPSIIFIEIYGDINNPEIKNCMNQIFMSNKNLICVVLDNRTACPVVFSRFEHKGSMALLFSQNSYI